MSSMNNMGGMSGMGGMQSAFGSLGSGSSSLSSEFIFNLDVEFIFLAYYLALFLHYISCFPT